MEYKYPPKLIESILINKNNGILKLFNFGDNVGTQISGSLYAMKCPIHQGEDFDFFVDVNNNSWYCPVCGKTGNAIDIIMETKDYTFDDAVKFLGERAKLAVRPREIETEDLSVFYDINQKAMEFYQSLLTDESAGRAYFDKRQLSQKTIDDFRLGFSPSYGQKLFKYLIDNGFERKDILLRSGLIGINAKGEYYDKFWNRVMYPIEANGKIIGFGGRVLDDSKPKYLNSPATPVFDKRQNLYGFDAADRSRERYVICCEGYMDVISMHQAGYTNSVASLGTALTPEQVHKIACRFDGVILAYDSDGPGTQAAIRAIKLCESQDVPCRVLNLTPCKDPDEFIKTYGKEQFEERLKNAESAGHFQIRIAREKSESIPDFFSTALDVLLKEVGKE